MFEGDTYSHRGWMNSDYFVKRALGTAFYAFVGQLVIFVPLMAIIVILSAIFAAFVFGMA